MFVGWKVRRDMPVQNPNGPREKTFSMTLHDKVIQISVDFEMSVRNGSLIYFSCAQRTKFLPWLNTLSAKDGSSLWYLMNCFAPEIMLGLRYSKSKVSKFMTAMDPDVAQPIDFPHDHPQTIP